MPDSTSQNISVARELATHAAQLDTLSRQFEELRKDNRTIMKSLEGVQSTLAEARGGWKLLMALGGASGAMGYLISHALHLLSKG